MTLNQKRIAAILIIVFVLTLLTGCGKSTPAVSDDPNIGIWKATKVEMFGDESDADEVFDGGFEIELKAGGKCELRAESKKDSYAWAIQGNTLTISASGADFISATIKDSAMVIGDFMGTGMKITLEKEGAVTSKPASSNAPAARDAGYYVIDSMTIDGERVTVKGTTITIKKISDASKTSVTVGGSLSFALDKDLGKNAVHTADAGTAYFQSVAAAVETALAGR